jgi:NADH dehydrogenase (ubiquinone) 1 alpha subcomplex subunit 9
MKVNTSRMIT